MAGATVMLYTSRAPLERSLASIECRHRAAPRVCGGGLSLARERTRFVFIGGEFSRAGVSVRPSDEDERDVIVGVTASSAVAGEVEQSSERCQRVELLELVLQL